VLEHASAMHYMGLLDLEQRAEAEARAASVAGHISNGARILVPGRRPPTAGVPECEHV
jgi:hypothetical protein